MTFILSQINNDGIFMASDSSETLIDPATGHETYVEVDKTIYFDQLNIGISTWGDAQVGGMSINDWLVQTLNGFTTMNKTERLLHEIISFLAKQLDTAFGFDGTTINKSVHMGLHVAGYNKISKDALPGICHVFIKPGSRQFDPQPTVLELTDPSKSYFLRNGMYEEFAMMWPALSGIDTSFRILLSTHYSQIIHLPKDLVALQAEWLGNWVKQMCLAIKMAGLPEYIGKTVKILSFNNNKEVRRFILPVCEEILHHSPA